jgi:hypothetical protein
MADLPAVASLADYLASLRHRRWQPGVLDCGVFMADWVMALCGRDPIADVRGSYRSERGFLKILRAEGGFEKSCAARLEATGFRETAMPADGDVMTVLAPYARRRGKIQHRPTGAICVSAAMRAVITSDLGVVIAGEEALPMLRAWTFDA